MIEFMTAYDVMGKFVNILEKERIRKDMTQKDLYKAAGMSASAYRTFMDTKNTKFENIINLMFALEMTSKLQELIKMEEFTSLEEIRNESNENMKKRVRRSKDD